MSKTERLRKRQESRGDPSAYLLNFLRNFAMRARLMHHSLASFGTQDNLIREAMRAYIIGVTSCLETFFRDLYVYLLNADPGRLREVVGRTKPGKRQKSDPPNEISDAEVAAELAKLQNLAGIDKALSEFFKPLEYLEILGATEFLCIIPARRPELASMKLWPGWQEQFGRIFDHRHEFAHNANAGCTIERQDMARFEAIALLIPQLTTFLVAQHFGANSHTFNAGAAPVVLLVEDLIADDWQIVPGQG